MHTVYFRIMVDDKDTVSSHPYVEFRGIAVYGISLDNGADRILGGTVGFPVAAVSDHFRRCGRYSAGRHKKCGGGKQT